MVKSSIPVHIVSLGCARNDVDSEELAASLEAGGFELVPEPADAAAVVVNTCGFIDAAKKDSIDTLLQAAELKSDGVRAVVAVGCLAERYGAELAGELPEADAVLGFDDYPDIAERVRGILDGERPVARVPVDRRGLLPTTPGDRQRAASGTSALTAGAPSQLTGGVWVPGHAPASGPVARRRLNDGPSAPLKIASGCDRRCAFCAIPAFRGAYLSRPIQDIVAEARWLVEHGVKEAVLVSENSSSYGKDLDVAHPFERLLLALGEVDGLEWIRVSYLQPAELRPSMIDVLTAAPHVVPYFDLPFQHASASVLRRMGRYGDAESFLGLLSEIRERAPHAGVRTNVIVGFPGETDADVEELAGFLQEARLDAIGVFGYSDEEGTRGATLDAHVDATEIATRLEWITSLADELMADRAADRVGDHVRLLVEETGAQVSARAEHQGPQTDGTTSVSGMTTPPPIGAILGATVVASDGVDLVAAVETK